MTHEIKLDKQQFCQVITGERHHVYALASHRIHPGDQICLIEFETNILTKTGRKCWIKITFIDKPFHFQAIRGGYCVFAFDTPPGHALLID